LPFSLSFSFTVPSGAHQYYVADWVGSISQGVTPEMAFQALLSNATPFQSMGPVQTGSEVAIPGLGTVSETVFPDLLEVVNTTELGNWLYPGNVFLQIVQQGDDIWVVTRGYVRRGGARRSF
jgi:hypothetical protein